MGDRGRPSCYGAGVSNLSAEFYEDSNSGYDLPRTVSDASAEGTTEKPRGNATSAHTKQRLFCTGMEISMLLSERTFEDLDRGRDIASDAMCATASLAPKRPAQVSAMDTIGPQIEAEIPFLQRVVRRWYSEAADADDLVQETLLRALASAHLWQPGTNLRGWLVTIMRNQFLETLSRTQRWAGAAEMIEIPDCSPAADAETRLTLRDVERAFHRLPTKQRAAV